MHSAILSAGYHPGQARVDLLEDRVHQQADADDSDARAHHQEDADRQRDAVRVPVDEGLDE
jgi:hypothetical protein